MNCFPAADSPRQDRREVLHEFAAVVEPELRGFFSAASPHSISKSPRLAFRTETQYAINHYFPIKDQTDGNVESAPHCRHHPAENLQKTFENLNLRLSRQMERLQMLLDVSSLVASNWDLPKVFPRISARIRRVLRQEYSSYSTP